MHSCSFFFFFFLLQVLPPLNFLLILNHCWSRDCHCCPHQNIHLPLGAWTNFQRSLNALKSSAPMHETKREVLQKPSNKHEYHNIAEVQKILSRNDEHDRSGCTYKSFYGSVSFDWNGRKIAFSDLVNSLSLLA